MICRQRRQEANGTENQGTGGPKRLVWTDCVLAVLTIGVYPSNEAYAGLSEAGAEVVAPRIFHTAVCHRAEIVFPVGQARHRGFPSRRKSGGSVPLTDIEACYYIAKAAAYLLHGK